MYKEEYNGFYSNAALNKLTLFLQLDKLSSFHKPSSGQYKLSINFLKMKIY